MGTLTVKGPKASHAFGRFLEWMLVAAVYLLWASSCDGNALRKERIGRLAVLIDKAVNVCGLSNSLLLTNIHEKHNINTQT